MPIKYTQRSFSVTSPDAKSQSNFNENWDAIFLKACYKCQGTECLALCWKCNKKYCKACLTSSPITICYTCNDEEWELENDT